MKTPGKRVLLLLWGYNCRHPYENVHYACQGIWELPPEKPHDDHEITRCVCPCHDGFSPYTGER